MGAAAQTLVSQKSFTCEYNIEGLPGDLKVHAVSEIVVTFEGTPASSTKSRSGAEHHQIRAPGEAKFDPVTISVHGNKDQTKAIFDCFDKCGKGNPLRGSFTVKITNPKDNYSDILEATLHDITLLSYSPFGSVDVDSPDTMSTTFTLSPDRIEFKA